MIISDLNHLEVVEESTSVVGGVLNVNSPQFVAGAAFQGSAAAANSGANNGINFGPATATSLNIGALTQAVTS
jgi:hypothetical protein